MFRNLVRLLSALSLVSLFFVPVLADAACDDPLGCVEVEPDDPIVVGAMLVVSGAINYLGEDTLGGVELALLARDNSLLDHEIELVLEDSLCTAEGGQVAAQRLAADPTVVGAIGTNCSSAAQGAIPIISESGLVMIAPSNTSPSLTNSDIAAGGSHLPGYFRTSQNGLIEGMRLAQFAARALKAETLATVHDGDPYTEGLSRAVADTFAELEGDVVFQGAVNKGDTDMSSILTEIAVHQPDVIYVPLFEPESNFFAAQMTHIAGLEDTIIIGGAASFSSSFPENTGEAAVGIYVSGPLVSGDAYEKVLEQWVEEYGSDPPSGYHAHAYDATNLLLEALEAVAIVSDDGSLMFGRQAIRDAVAATEDYPGLTGRLTCREDSPYAGDCSPGTALAVFIITEAEVFDDNWPPPLAWNFSVDTFD
ncbi:MAG: branched-chain amino acid ABC transporter substrate-binding protein [Chloroflexota bacterium]|nr:branched-chain amino acid ABC transporter substrate-binding protein [Chloroflexota bacterium]